MTGLDDFFEDDAVADWSAATVVGPPLAGKGAFLARLLRSGLERGDGVVLITTDESAADSVGRYPGLDRDGLRIVDATGTRSDDERVAVVSSPADLTGIGLEFERALAALYDDGFDRVWVGVDALTTLEVYTDAERVSRFVHVLASRFDAVDAHGLFVVHGAPSEQRFDTHTDIRVEFREEPESVAFRIVGRGGPTPWRQFDPATHTVSATVDSATSPGGTEGRWSVSSLADLIEAVDDERLTLTVVNAGRGTVDRLAPLFDRLQVDVRAATLDVDVPTDVALLHRGGDLLAADAVAPLLATAEGLDDPADSRRTGSEILERASRALYNVDASGRSELVRTSRLVETIAARTGTGTLHAGFQQLSRLADDAETLRLYRRLADADVDVHLYGDPDARLPETFTVHGAPAEELAETWFVVFDGAGNTRRMGALLARETTPGRYNGFWSYQPPVVAGLVAYLDAEYGSASA